MVETAGIPEPITNTPVLRLITPHFRQAYVALAEMKPKAREASAELVSPRGLCVNSANDKANARTPKELTRFTHSRESHVVWL